jgi:hypothetical protein
MFSVGHKFLVVRSREFLVRGWYPNLNFWWNSMWATIWNDFIMFEMANHSHNINDLLIYQHFGHLFGFDW